MRRNRFQSLTLIFLVGLGTVLAVLGEMAPQSAIKSKGDKLANLFGVSYEWFWVISTIVITALVFIATFIKERFDSTDKAARTDSYESQEERDRGEFLADLAGRYEQRYAHKLDRRYEIPLLVGDEVEGTYSQLSDEDFDTDAHMSKAAQYVIERFETRGRLLLVGSAGSGKTVLLLNLAKYLVEKAHKDASQPLPVIFNLASWSRDYASFGDWVAAMLTKGYSLSSDFAKHLQEEQRIVYLLDGLDELTSTKEDVSDAKVRDECLASLYRFFHDGSMSTVICCRRNEFDEMIWQTGTEPLVPMLTVHDLSPLRVNRALIRASHLGRDKFAASHLQAVLSHDHDNIYYQVLSTPFYFTTTLQVFDSTKPPHIDAPDQKTLENQLVAAFIKKKLEVTPNAHRYAPARTLSWLTWLAVFLKGKATFELSDLQPSALKREWRYRLLFSMAFGIAGGLIAGLVSWHAHSGVLYGTLFSFMGVYMITRDFAQWLLAPLRRRRLWIILLLVGLIASVVSGCLFLITRIIKFGIIDGFIMPPTAILVVFAFVLFMGLLAVMIGVAARLYIRVIYGILGGVPVSDIVTEDFKRWALPSLRRWRTWHNILQSGLEGSVSGFIMTGVFYGCMAIVFILSGASEGIVSGAIEGVFMVIALTLVAGLAGAPLGVLLGLLLGLLRACSKTARVTTIHSPYQRLRAGTIVNILQMVVLGIIFTYLLIMVNLLIGSSASKRLDFSLMSFSVAFPLLLFGLIGLFKAPLLKHSLLRACLTAEGALPLRYVDFLNYATELHILEKDGGQWRFRHQILQDYFVSHSQNSGSILTQP